jgi:hypothetical protein
MKQPGCCSNTFSASFFKSVPDMMRVTSTAVKLLLPNLLLKAASPKLQRLKLQKIQDITLVHVSLNEFSFGSGE